MWISSSPEITGSLAAQHIVELRGSGSAGSRRSPRRVPRRPVLRLREHLGDLLIGWGMSLRPAAPGR